MSEVCLSMELPPCELHELEAITELVACARSSRARKEQLALVLKQQNYIPQLLRLFQACENSKNAKGLHLLFGIVRGILYLDQASLFEVMFSDECMLDVVGCLEYDPSLAQPERHREFLKEIAKHQEFIPVRDPNLRHKVRQVSTARYIHDIILPNPSAFEEGFLSTLSSFIKSSKVEISGALLQDETFLSEIFAQLKDEATADEQRCVLMKFFRELCNFSFRFHTKKVELYKTVIKLGILNIIKMLMGMNNLQVRCAAVDILYCLTHFSPSTVQKFVMREARQSGRDTYLLIMILEHMISRPDPGPGGDSQLMEILSTLIGLKNMKDKASKSELCEFLDFFYDRCIHILTAPLVAVTSGESSEKDDYRTAEILTSVLELLCCCVHRHQSDMKKYVMSEDLLRRVLILMKSKHTFLALAALHFMRKIIGLKDHLYNSYIIQRNLLEPVVNALLDKGMRCNLLSSAVLELFEFIRVENIQSLIAHVVENFSDKLESIKYVHTFERLKAKYKQEKDGENPSPSSVPRVFPLKIHVRQRRDSKHKKSRVSKAGEQAPPTSPDSSNASCPRHEPPATVPSPVKRRLFEEICFSSDDEDEEEAPPRKRAHPDC